MKRNIWQYLKETIRKYLAGIVAVGVILLLVWGGYWLAKGFIWVVQLVNWKEVLKNPELLILAVLAGIFIDNLGTLTIAIFNKITNGAIERGSARRKAKKSMRMQKRQSRRERKAAEKRRREEMYRCNHRVEEDQDYQDDEAE